MFFKIVAKIFENFTGKHLRWSLFLINFITNKLQDRFFLVKFAKFLGTSFYRAPRLLLLYSPRTFSILAMKIIILVLEDSMYLQLIYFLNIIPFWFTEHNFLIDGTLSLANYFQSVYCAFYLPLKSAIMENSRHCINYFQLFYN